MLERYLYCVVVGGPQYDCCDGCGAHGPIVVVELRGTAFRHGLCIACFNKVGEMQKRLEERLKQEKLDRAIQVFLSTHSDARKNRDIEFYDGALD